MVCRVLRWMGSIWRSFLCLLGAHYWDYPGGHCEDCGECDEFFGPHYHKEAGFEL